jgi:DNA-binding transcriptional ArsR family regulator
MSVKLRLPTDPSLIRYAYSPALEAALSIHVLCGPKQHALHLPWVRACRDLTPELKREIRRYSFFFEEGVGGLFLPPGRTVTFEEALELASEVSDHEIVGSLTAFLIAPGMPDGTIDDMQSGVRASLAEGDVETRAIVEAIFADPRAELSRFLAMMARYWEEAFAVEWKRARSSIEDSISLAVQRRAAGGEESFFTAFPGQFVFDRKAGELRFDRPFDSEMDATSQGGMVLVPSVYSWPHVMLSTSKESAVTMVYPVATLASTAILESPPRELVGAFRVLGDETRLQILRLLAQMPRSTQELAALCHLSEPAVSRHLSQLSREGLVEAHREGYYVVYEVLPERLKPLSDALMGFIGHD